MAPGITEELQRRGAVAYDPGKGIYVYGFGCAFKRGLDLGLTVLAASRRLINETLQDMVVSAGGDRLTIRDKTSVKGLLWEEADGGVHGVILDGGEEVRADLVLWAGGRRSHLTLPKWLGEQGVAVPSPLKVDVKVSYAARWMLLPPDFDPQNEFFTAIVHSKHAMRKGMALVVEGGRVQFTLIGSGGERAPLDHEGWMEWARSLPDPAVANLAARCTPDGPISRYASAPGVAMFYHRAKMPRGLAVLGDAAVASNPVYGQGMTLAAKGARILNFALEKALSGQSNPTERREAARGVGLTLQRQLFWGTHLQWYMCAVEDMRIVSAELAGGLIRPPSMTYPVTEALMSACGEDEKVATTMMRVLQCVDSPMAVVGTLPRVAAVVARRWWRRACTWAVGPKGE